MGRWFVTRRLQQLHTNYVHITAIYESIRRHLALVKLWGGGGGGDKAGGISESLAKSGEVQGARHQRHMRRRRAARCIGAEAMPEAETGRDFGTGDGSFNSHVVAVFGGPNRKSGTRNR